MAGKLKDGSPPMPVFLESSPTPGEVMAAQDQDPCLEINPPYLSHPTITKEKV